MSTLNGALTDEEWEKQFAKEDADIGKDTDVVAVSKSASDALGIPPVQVDYSLDEPIDLTNAPYLTSGSPELTKAANQQAEEKLQSAQRQRAERERVAAQQSQQARQQAERKAAADRMAAEAEQNKKTRAVTEADNYDDFFAAADDLDPDVDTSSQEYLEGRRARSRMQREAEENMRKYGSYDPSADEAVESGGMTAEDYTQLSKRAGQPRAEPTMEEQQGTGPQVQRNEDGSVQGEPTTDPDEERRNRELAEMYDDTGLSEKEAREQAFGPEASQQEGMDDYLDATGAGSQDPVEDGRQDYEDATGVGSQDTGEQESTGYTEETAADAFGETEEAGRQDYEDATGEGSQETDVPGQADYEEGTGPGSQTPPPDDTPQEDKPPEQVQEEDNRSMLDWAQDEMRAVVDSMGFDEDEYRDTQTAAAEQRLLEAERRLAARFAFTPGGTQSGQAMGAFASLTAQYNQELSDIETEILDRNDKVRTEKLGALQNTFTTAITSDLDQQKIDNQMEQFNEQLVISLKELGLNEQQTTAAVSKIYAEIGNEKLRTSADVAAIWAGLTGETGQSGTITAADLGIDLDDADLASAFLGGGDAGKRVAISESYFAMTGQRPSDEQINSILGGAGVEVESMPTMEARKLAAQVTSDNMERAAKYKSIAEQNGLQREQFEQGQKEYDDQWALTTGDVAGQFGLDQSKFTLANFDLEAYESKLNLDTTLEPQVRNELLTNFKRQKAEEFDNPAAFLDAHNLFRDTVGNQRADIATKRNMDADAFANASRQADAAEARFLETWATISQVEPQEIATDETFQGEAGEQLAARVRDSVFTPLAGIITDSFGEEIGDQTLTPEQLNTVVDNAMADSDYVNNTRKQLEIAFPGNIFTDTDIRLTLENSMLDLKDVTANDILAGETVAVEPSPDQEVRYMAGNKQRYGAYGDLTAEQKAAYMEQQQADAPTKFGISKVFSTPSDWFAGLGPEAQSSIISLIGGQMQQSNQQKTRGGGFFGAVGRVAGMALGAYTGGLGSGMGETIAKKVF
jgi:hypothetical protein